MGMQLNPQQDQAVKTKSRKVLVLAGAGSGKTRVLTTRIIHLLKHDQVNPESIVGLTFTNKAAEEMRQRIAKMVDPMQAKLITLSTFHSFCLRILREDIHYLGYTKDFTIYDEQDVQRVVKTLAADLIGSDKQLPSIKDSLTRLSWLRNGMETVETLTNTDSKWHSRFVGDLKDKLDEALQAYNALDFDHILSMTVELLEKHPLIRKKYQERFQWILIDEYQDTNPIQDKLTHLLVGDTGNLCVVGDDDQSIYSFRGANVENILKFDADEKILLDQNYRSTNTILKAANAVIQHNSSRYEKNLWSEYGEGDRIAVFVAPDEQKEAEAVVHRIAKYKKDWNMKWSDFAILYRSNALSRNFEMALSRYTWFEGDQWNKGIPFEVFGGTSFISKKEIKDVAAYIKYLVNPLDEQSLLRIINLPRRGIGAQAIQNLKLYARENHIPLYRALDKVAMNDAKIALPVKTVNSIQDFVFAYRSALELLDNNATEAVRSLITSLNFEASFAEDVKSDKMQQVKKENLNFFMSSLGSLPSALTGKAYLNEALAQFSLDEESFAKTKKKNPNAVSLMTLHSSKGLEFPVCFLTCVERDIIPHQRSMDNQVDEERRLMYVGITRAQKKLVLSMAQSRSRIGGKKAAEPSSFLHDIPKELLHVTHWNQV